MRSRISDELANDGDITTAQINYAINDAIKHYERSPWWWNQKTATFSTVDAQEYYSSSNLSDIPDIVQIVSAVVTHGGVKSKLPAWSYESIDDMQDGTVEGVPCAFAVFKENIRLYPIPDGVYTVTLSYIYRLTALSEDSDSNAWTTDAEDLIRQSAKRRIAINYLNADDLAARFAAMEREAFDQLLAENRRRRPNTVLRVPNMLNSGSFDINTGY